MDALTYIPILISSLALALVSFSRKRKQKTLWLATATIIFIGTLIWTLNVLGVFQ